MSQDLERWIDLFNEFQVRCNPFLSSEEDLQIFEAHIGFKLPKEYREYCQVFGTGMFYETIVVYDVCSSGFIYPWNPVYRMFCQLEDFKEALRVGYRRRNPEVLSMIDSWHIFGRRALSGTIFFIFDLSSYGELDQACDIYMVADSNLGVIKLGRSFYQFVCDYCIGSRLKEEFPDYFGDDDIYEDENEKDTAAVDKNEKDVLCPVIFCPQSGV
jgi:hypothetical protein